MPTIYRGHISYDEPGRASPARRPSDPPRKARAEVLAKAREWKAANRERIKAYMKAYRVRRKAAEPPSHPLRISVERDDPETETEARSISGDPSL